MREVDTGAKDVDCFVTDPNPYGLGHAYVLHSTLYPESVYLVDTTLSSHEDGGFWTKFALTKRVIALVLTHLHQDHCRGMDVLAVALQKPVWSYKTFKDGDVFDEWRVIFTPGHAEDHICLFRPKDRVLIAGDMVYPEGRPLIPKNGGNTGDYEKSLAKLKQLRPSKVLSGHGVGFELPA